MTSKYVWAGIAVGTFFAGLGIGYAIYLNTYSPTMMFQNPQMWDQLMVRSPEGMRQWMNTMLTDPQMSSYMMSQMYQNPQFMQSMMQNQQFQNQWMKPWWMQHNFTGPGMMGGR